jgi:hypothetical protein
MSRLGQALVVLALLRGEAVAQGAGEDKAARCYQLAGLADRWLTRRGEGSGGPNMIVVGARLDCDKGRYDSAIRDLERVLRGQGITVPPPA